MTYNGNAYYRTAQYCQHIGMSCLNVASPLFVRCREADHVVLDCHASLCEKCENGLLCGVLRVTEGVVDIGEPVGSAVGEDSEDFGVAAAVVSR